MNNDSENYSLLPSAPSLEPVAPKTNYKRWMTDMSSALDELKIHELAIPGAHNSGVDMAGTWGPWELWGACQNKSFPEQLSAGTRFLDLRLIDNSYKKTTGNHSPTTRFYEVFEFNHNIANAGRRLEHLIRDVKNFVTENPGEIVILGFHKYDKGRFSDSLERCLPYFTPIKNLLIPYAASDLKIGEIRVRYPSGRIILAFDYGSPKNWKSEWVQKNELWPNIKHQWSSDYSEESIKQLVINAMESPPTQQYWALSAAARNATGPIHLKHDHPIRTEVFKTGRQNANIVMVDFIERTDTVIGVTDRCIQLNRERAMETLKPVPPRSLIVKQVEEQNSQNTLRFEWIRGEDNTSIRRFEMYEGNNYLFTTTVGTHAVKNLPLKNYTFKVRSVNTVGDVSDFSQPFTLVQDQTPPTAPENFRFAKAGLRLAELEWDPSFDEAGIAHYEISIDDQAPAVTTEPYYKARGLVASKTHKFKVRAKDINGFYSEYTELALQPRPEKLENPMFEIKEIIPDLPAYTISITWDVVENAQDRMSYNTIVNIISHKEQVHEDGIPPTRSLLAIPGITTKVQSNILYFTGERTENETFEFIFDPVPPLPVRDLKIQSRTPTSTVITWLGSFSTNTENYAISLNEEPPTLVPKTITTYEFQELPLDQEFLIEVWAINNFTIPSIVRSVTIDPLPGYVGAPKNFRFSQILLPVLEWDPPHQPVNNYRVILIGPGGNELTYNVTEPRLGTILLPRTRYDVRITAHNEIGGSAPLIAEFTTL